jgi:hypothetical protein
MSAKSKDTDMTAEFTWDVFSTLDGYGTYTEDGDWGGYWSKQGPELLEHRAALFDSEQRWSSEPPRFGRMLQSWCQATTPTRFTSGTS